MVIGVGELQLGIDGVFSLKEKRSVVKKIITRTRNKFNVAIAEVDDLDVLNRATIGISVVGNEAAHVNSCMDKVLNFIDALQVAEIIYDNFELVKW